MRHIPTINVATDAACNGILVAVALLFALFFSSSPVFAAAIQNTSSSHANGWSCGNPDSGHCYGETYWGGANGADTQISINIQLSGGGPYDGYSFVTTEMWLADGTYWVEAGIISEYAVTGSSYPFYFWADNRPNGGGFAFHYLANETNSGTALARIVRNGSSNWNVLVRDRYSSFTGTSTANNFSVGYIELGSELYNNNQTAYEPNIYYSNNRWWNGSTFIYQGNDGTRTNVDYPNYGNWYNGHEPIYSSTGGVWYSCISGRGC